MATPPPLLSPPPSSPPTRSGVGSGLVGGGALPLALPKGGRGGATRLHTRSPDDHRLRKHMAVGGWAASELPKLTCSPINSTTAAGSGAPAPLPLPSVRTRAGCEPPGWQPGPGQQRRVEQTEPGALRGVHYASRGTPGSLDWRRMPTRVQYSEKPHHSPRSDQTSLGPAQLYLSR